MSTVVKAFGNWELNGEFSPFRRHFLAGGNKQNPLNEPVDFNNEIVQRLFETIGNF